MTSKKRSGDDPEVVLASGGSSSKAPEGAKAPHRGQGFSQEYMNGRRSVWYELMDRGLLNSQKLSTEILFLLPDAFIDFYTTLFHQALSTGDSSVMHGKSGGVDKAKGEQGMVTGSDTKLQAQGGGGKRFKNPVMVVKNERAMDAKRMVDKELLRIMGEAGDMLRRARLRDNASLGGGRETQGPSALDNQASPLRCLGYKRTWVDRGDGVRPRCGLFLKGTWKYCPTCGTAVADTQLEAAVMGEKYRADEDAEKAAGLNRNKVDRARTEKGDRETGI